MKAKICFYTLAALLLAACSNEEGVMQPSTRELQVSASLPSTRVSTKVNDFVDGDQIGLFVTYPDTSLFNNGSSNFYAQHVEDKWNIPYRNITLSDDDVFVWGYYPYDYQLTGYQMSINIAPKGGLGQTEYLYSGPVVANVENPQAHLQFRYALAEVVFKMTSAQEGLRLMTASLRNATGQSVLSTTGTMNVLTGEIVASGTPNENLMIAPNEMLSSTPLDLRFLAIPTTVTANSLTVSLYINGAYYNVAVPAGHWEAGKCYNYNLSIGGDSRLTISLGQITPRENTDMEGLSLTNDDELLEIGGKIGKPVDLGLKVLWADRNVGASSPNNVGKYLFYGCPIEPMAAQGICYHNLENLNISGTDRDVVYMQWGNGWRMPTRDEWQELIDNCTCSPMIDGITYQLVGYQFTSKVEGYTDKSIFFPVSGFYDQSKSLSLVEQDTHIYLPAADRQAAGGVWEGYYMPVYIMMSASQSTPYFTMLLDYNSNATSATPVRGVLDR